MAKILIIDSEIETCDFLKNFFTEKGFKVSIATTKKEAVDKVEKVCPKIVLPYFLRSNQWFVITDNILNAILSFEYPHF